jgi:hypothetical protein
LCTHSTRATDRAVPRPTMRSFRAICASRAQFGRESGARDAFCSRIPLISFTASTFDAVGCGFHRNSCTDSTFRRCEPPIPPSSCMPAQFNAPWTAWSAKPRGLCSPEHNLNENGFFGALATNESVDFVLQRTQRGGFGRETCPRRGKSVAVVFCRAQTQNPTSHCHAATPPHHPDSFRLEWRRPVVPGAGARPARP